MNTAHRHLTAAKDTFLNVFEAARPNLASVAANLAASASLLEAGGEPELKAAVVKALKSVQALQKQLVATGVDTCINTALAVRTSPPSAG